MTIARDKYPEYLAEKLWQWIPEVYRDLDGKNGQDALHGFISAVASQAAILKRSQDRLWDDTCIELASDWAVPYLGQLLGTRMVSALNTWARRVDTAKTIYYRRRSGTVAVLEQLIADITSWDGKIVEEYRRLARYWHMLDCPVSYGRLTHTPVGGIADIRVARGTTLVGDPFDEFHYTAEFRNLLTRYGSRHGRRNIDRLSFHIYRLQPVTYRGVVPRRLLHLADGRDAFTFDPSGRDVALFSRNEPRVDWTTWRTAAEWELPRPIACRLLGEAVFEITADEIAWILSGAPIATLAERQAAADDLRKLIGQRFMHAADLARILAGMPSAAVLTAPGVQAGLLQRAIVRDCGSAALLPNGQGQAPWPVQTASDDASFGNAALLVGYDGDPDPVGRSATRAGNLEGFSPSVIAGIDLIVEPERGRFVLDTGANNVADVRVAYNVGMFGPIGAGAFGRDIVSEPATVTWQGGSHAAGTPIDGIVEIEDSENYVSPPNQPNLEHTAVRAAEGERPYLILNNHWRLTANGDDRTLFLDGLWLGSRNNTRHLMLDGNYETVTLRYCTLDPGGETADGNPIRPVHLVVRGFVEHLIVDQSILGVIRLMGANASIENITITDSVIHSIDPAQIAVNAPRAQLNISRSTVIADDIATLAINVERIFATDTLVAGTVDATDVQNGCFRFSARSTLSRVPHPYESHFISEISGLFSSLRFGDHRYAQLSPVAPVQLVTGGENGSEIGTFNREISPIRKKGLQSKVYEFLPFGRTPNFIIES